MTISGHNSIKGNQKPEFISKQYYVENSSIFVNIAKKHNVKIKNTNSSIYSANLSLRQIMRYTKTGMKLDQIFSKSSQPSLTSTRN
jgi:hypothetical protein